MDEDPEDALNSCMETLRSLSRLGQDHGYDINSRLRYVEQLYGDIAFTESLGAKLKSSMRRDTVHQIKLHL